jgi:hypothetical protein
LAATRKRSTPRRGYWILSARSVHDRNAMLRNPLRRKTATAHENMAYQAYHESTQT